MFGRSRKEDTVQEEVEEEVRPQLYDESELWQIPGPREEYEVDTSVDYVDLGSLRIPAVPGMQIRARFFRAPVLYRRCAAFGRNLG